MLYSLVLARSADATRDAWPRGVDADGEAVGDISEGFTNEATASRPELLKSLPVRGQIGFVPQANH